MKKVLRVMEAAKFSADKMAKVNLFETDRFFCDVYCLGPGQEQRVHRHAGNDKVYVQLQGVSHVTLGDEIHELGNGCVAWAPAGEDHGIRNDSDENVVVLVFMAPHPRST